MRKLSALQTILAGGASVAVLATSALASEFNVPSGDLRAALNLYAKQARVELIYPVSAVEGVHTRGARGDLSSDEALAAILRGTGFDTQRTPSGAIGIVRAKAAPAAPVRELADAEPVHAAASVETVVVTSSKIKGDIQTVPIAITALSQEQLTSRQIAGGPDLVKEVPNLTFSKTNFSGYNLEIRGIGTQAISVATDPAVAVALNDTPFIRNHFFEQEFYDVSQVEVLRGPQGTLYGRNATAGVVNVISAKPTDQFEAMLSADWGNYANRRYEGMINIPITDDRLDLRVAGEWTKRNGYTHNETTGSQIDGRDLWSSRVTVGWHPYSWAQAYLVWEHFQENDDRLRSSKQLCKTDLGPGVTAFGGPGVIDGVPLPGTKGSVFTVTTATFSQGCSPTSMYSPDAFGVPNGFSLPFISGAAFEGLINTSIDPYSSTTQSTNLRDIQSAIEPKYRAKNDTLELNADFQVTPSLTLTSATGYNKDFLWSTEDYNRFDTSPGIFISDYGQFSSANAISPDGVFCDPQLGCSNRLVVQDLSDENAWQLSQEFRLASNFSGPFNFSVGGNYLHYETEENYYVFSNTFTLISIHNIGFQGVWDPVNFTNTEAYCLANGFDYSDPKKGGGIPTEGCQYIDPNPITNLNNNGHNYFLSQNPYVLNSYAGFGEAYYNVTRELKLTAGARWTDDQKHFLDLPSWVVADGWGYPVIGEVNQKWNEWTGRFAANWTPQLDFTNQTLIYGSYSHGYKAGGANPPGAVFITPSQFVQGANIFDLFPTHPLTFKPEFIDAYELGTKNTMLDGGLTLNGDVFFYNYKGYQISKIVDRTAINDNFDATVRGAELEASYEPLPGLKFNFAGGYEDTSIGKNQYSIDLMDRADRANHPNWIVMKPSVGVASNCIFPDYVAAAIVYADNGGGGEGDTFPASCGVAYTGGLDPATEAPYTANPSGNSILPGYHGYDPFAGAANDPYTGQNTFNGVDYGPAPNNGEGFAKNVGGNELPNAPHFTTSLSAEYTMPVSEDWAATLHSDFYWQSQSFARVFNDRPFDKIRGYSNVNLAFILTSANGWQVLGYLKNVFDTTAITGTFLNSDDTGLTNNVFLTDPRLFGVRVTKNW